MLVAFVLPPRSTVVTSTLCQDALDGIPNCKLKLPSVPQMNEVADTSVQTVTLALGSQIPSIIRIESRLLVRFVISYNSITGVIVSLSTHNQYVWT